MITEDGNVKRYIESDKVDEFNVGDSADLSYPNGYGKGNRVMKESSPTVTATTANTIVVKENTILIPEATKKGYAEASDGDGVYINRPHQKRGVVQKDKIQTLKTTPDVGVVVEKKIKYEEPLEREGWHNMNKIVLNPEGISTTINAQSNNSLQKIKEPSLRIRKLTPLECWRLMGFDDEDFYKAQSVGTSNTQLYKQAGNIDSS